MSDFRKTLNEIVDLKNGKKPTDYDDFRATAVTEQTPKSRVDLKKTIEFNPAKLNVTHSILKMNVRALTSDGSEKFSPRSYFKSQIQKTTI